MKVNNFVSCFVKNVIQVVYYNIIGIVYNVKRMLSVQKFVYKFLICSCCVVGDFEFFC